MKHLTFISLVVSICLITCAMAQESAFEYPFVTPGALLLKLKEPHPLVPAKLTSPPICTGIADLDLRLDQISATAWSEALPGHQPDLYHVKFNPATTVEAAMLTLREWEGTAAVYPCQLVPMAELKSYPNDLLLPNQWHHEQIHSPGAWGIYQGSDTVQVAIIDGGVNYNHPDLASNVWINPGEDLNGNRIIDIEDWNGEDNDGNGYVDDFWGWDWVDVYYPFVWPGEDPGPPDADPMDFGGHGTHCAGDAAAATDNLVGVASPGYNCQIMCLRAGYMGSDGNGWVQTYAAAQAVYYAIDQHAEVISMSFGGGQDITLRNALWEAADSGLVLVAAAGNESSLNPIYPAGQDSVIAVAATGPGDIMADFTNYGGWINVCAPGVSIYSTTMGGWGNMSGTSMATPVTAGLPALVKSLKPEWNSVEVGSWLARTADNIDTQNPGYIGMMGGGRINAAQAVDIFVSVDSLWELNAQGGDRLHFGEAGSLLVRYHKYLGTAANVTLTMSSSNPRVSFSQPNYYIGTLLEGESGDNSSDPFRLTVQNGGADYEIIAVDAHFSGDDFQFTQKLEFPVGRAQVLIIDADQNQSKRTSSYYEQTLDSLGCTHETWRRQDRQTLGSELQQYPVVIHFSGTAVTNIFPGNDWTDLQNYLNYGGNLIVSGQNVAQDLAVSQPAVLTFVLKVQYLQASSGIFEVRGSPGNPLTEGMYLVMAGSGGAGNQNSMDMVAALSGAEPFFVYRTNFPTQLAGVRVQSSFGDMFYCAFGLEGINDSTASATKRIDVLRMMFEQFNITSVSDPEIQTIQQNPVLYPPHPNPFNSMVTINYSLPNAAPVTITIYDLLGKQVVVHQQALSLTGSNRWNWQVTPEMSSGIYFIELKTPLNRQLQKIVFLK